MGEEKGWDIEKALNAAGSWGRFQKILLVMSFAAAIPNGFVILHFVFSHYAPQHHCTFPEEYSSYVNQSVENQQAIISVMIPLERNQRNEWVWSQCKMYDRNYSQYPVETWSVNFADSNDSSIVDCTEGISYDSSKADETAAMEFSMVCDDDWKGPLVVSLFGVGMALGGALGVTGDWYGRRPVFILVSLLQILSEVICALSWNFPIYLASVLLSGASSIINYIVYFILATEVTDHKWRNFLSISSAFGFTIGYCSVTLFAYIFRQWRVFIGSMAVVGAIIYIPCCWFFPESPRWLAQKGRSDDSIRCLKWIARVNGRKREFEDALEAQEVKCVVSKHNITASGIMETISVLLRSGIATRFCTVAYGWLTCTLVYLCFSIYSTDFSKDRFVNFFLGGLVEIPACAIGFALLKYLGRPRTTLLLMCICGVSSMVLPFVPDDLGAVSMIFALLGKGSIAGIFFAWYLIATEVLPTLQRSSALSICSTISRIGSFCSPYLMYLRKYNYWMPNLAMGIICISSGLLAIFYIPETLGVNLPDTVHEAKANKRLYRLNVLKNFDVVSVNREDDVEKKSMI